MSNITFSNNALTSASRLCDFDWKGFASRESKLGSPAPGTNKLVNPLAVPTPNTSSYGQKLKLLIGVTKRWRRYGLFAVVTQQSLKKN